MTILRNKKKKHKIKPGMIVEATKGDLGEEDVSKPHVTDVIQNQDGDVEKLVMRKGVVFKKEIEVPADRIRAVKHGKVIIDAQAAETEAMTAVGLEEMKDEQDMLDEVEQVVPTTEKLREKEAAKALNTRNMANIEQTDLVEDDRQSQISPSRRWLHILGPGFLGGMAGNDASAVTSYSIDGAENGLGHLWLLLISTPLYQSTQYACAKIGRTTQKGLAEILREHYGRPAAVFASLVLIVANVALIAADLVAIGSGLQLLFQSLVNWIWFILPVAALLWYLSVYRNFESLKKIFVAMSFVFIAYIITAFLTKPNWGTVLMNTVIPHIDFNFDGISSAVALLGATISPYTIFWQVQGEKEEVRPGTKMKQQMHFAAGDIAVGVTSGNLVAYFIIICTANTLFIHHKHIQSAADAAQALVPVLGPFAEELFAIGLIGAGFVAIPILLASTSYAVAGTFGWPAGLSKKPWQNEGFYIILTFALLISVVLAFIHINPIQLLFWANVLNGVLSPVLVIYLIIIGNSRKVVGGQRLDWLTNIGLVMTALVMFAASAFLFYGLFTGHGN